MTRQAISAAAAAILAAAIALGGCGGDEDSGVDTTSGTNAGAVLPGGGLTVGEALETEAEPPLAVNGWLVGSGEDARLCSSYEPDAEEPCVEPSLALEGDLDAESGTQVSLLGAVDDGTFLVSATTR